MLGLSFAGLGSRLGASFIQDARNGFCVLVGFFVERASDLRHWQPIRLWPVDQHGYKNAIGGPVNSDALVREGRKQPDRTHVLGFGPGTTRDNSKP